MKEIIVATKNRGKVREMQAVLADLPVKLLSLEDFPDVPEAVEDGNTFLDNALIKAKHYREYTQRACLADDSGLEVDALAGAPGVLSARYAGEQGNDKANNEKLLKELAAVPTKERTARFRCALVFYDTDDTYCAAEGTCEGYILEEFRGDKGFGYDPLFELPDKQKTLAELSVEDKNAVSHRGQALKNMVKSLSERFA